jgi:multiple sugar transport system substrate-binding protein
MKKTTALVLAAFMLAAMLAGCQSATPSTQPATSPPATSAPVASTPAPTEAPVYNPKAYAGTELVFSCLDTANYKKMDNLLPYLEVATGIKLTIDYIPENAYMTKLQVVLSSQTGEYDACYANNKMYPVLFPSGWLQPLDSYLNDPTKTDPNYNYADFVPKISANLNYEGKIMGIPFGTESNILYYNKKMFAAAGLTAPPQTMQDVYDYAKKLNKPEIGQAGIAMLGTREGNVNGYGWIMMWLGMGGSWTPAGQEKYTVLASETAIKTTEMWADMLRNYGPQGISNYGWNELYLAMQQEKVAMVIATTKDYPLFTDPAKSKIADHLGYACIKGQGTEYTVGNIGAWVVPSSGKHIDAAWTAIQFMTSKESQTNQVIQKDVVDVTRQSVIDSTVFGSKYNAEWAAATKEAYSHGCVQYTPLIPQGGQIREYLAIALSKALSGQATAKDAMVEANENVKKLLAEQK